MAIQSKTLDGYLGAIASSVITGPLRGVGPSFERIGKKDDLKIITRTREWCLPTIPITLCAALLQPPPPVRTSNL